MIDAFSALLFDAGGTLLHPYPSVGEIYAEVADRYGTRVASQDIQKKFMEEWRRRDGMSQLTVHVDEKIEKDWWRAIVRDVFAPFGLVERFEEFFEELYDLFARPEVWRLYPGAPEVLGELRRRGKRLAIVSNWDSRLFKLCDGLGITGYFEFILASAVFGASKPGPRIFEEALRRLEIEPSQALHIGDSFEDDIKGASAVGIPAVLIDRHRHFDGAAAGPFRPRRVIRDLAELL